MKNIACAFCIVIALASFARAAETSVAIDAVQQEAHVPHIIEAGARSIAIGPDEQVYAGTEKGLARIGADASPQEDGYGPIPFMGPTADGIVFVANGRVIRMRDAVVEDIADVSAIFGGALAVDADGEAILVGGPEGLWRVTKKKARPVSPLNNLLQSSATGTGKAVRGIAVNADEIAVAAAAGLYVRQDDAWTPVYPHDENKRWAPVDVRAVAYDSKGRLWFACPQGVGCRNEDGTWHLYTGAEGLPYNDFTSMAAAPDGAMWFGTTKGAIKFRDGVWEFRQSKRWLVNDDVRAIAVAANGDAWFATAGGVSCIESRPITLMEKARHYEDLIDAHNKRTPYGYVVNAGLKEPGDLSTSFTTATDNDGQYTGLYAGAEALAYGATKDPYFKKRATEAFEALAFLSEVTQGGEHPAPRGFIARAIMPTDGPNPNDHNTPERDREKQKGDKLWKVIIPRWPTSADGKWYWKSDTSSDELDGHFFAYGLYYDLVAETEEEKARAREVVGRVADHLIEHNYCLVDHDGQPTRWARFAPEYLNHDPDHWTERGLNSLSLLTYLSIAHHVTGDQKYRDHYMKLVDEHSYAINGMVMPKLQFGPGSHVQFDDKMAFMNFYHLIQYETDPELLRMYYTSIYYYWNIEKYEMNPFFNFVYAVCCLGKIRTDQWGDLDLTPQWPWLEQGVDTLKRYPMDLVEWPMTNSHRIDLLPLPDHVREPGGNEGHGYRVNGLVLPIDERQSLSWSEDTWEFDTGGNGQRLRDGCPYLLAYYMGLYHGYIR